MATYVAVCGAKISCNGTRNPTEEGIVVGTTDEEATGCGGSILTEADILKGENLSNFGGGCKFLPHPIGPGRFRLCNMRPDGRWKFTAKGFGDTGERILKSNSKFNCLNGGVVRITDPNQDQIETDLVEAHEDAIELLEDKLNDLENNWDDPAVQAEFERWFGEERNRDLGWLPEWLPGIDVRFDRHDIIDRLKKTIEALEDMDEDNFKPASVQPTKRQDVNARVYPNDDDHTIYIADGFSGNKATGALAGSDKDSQAGILVHETAHFDDVAGLRDIEHDECVDKCYGNTESEALADNDPEAAEKNTDNFQGYVQS